MTDGGFSFCSETFAKVKISSTEYIDVVCIRLKDPGIDPTVGIRVVVLDLGQSQDWGLWVRSCLD
eukprot:m.175945 g.175945  ORF g.175945 m.175945 type:complete len:65 (-) comp14894_c1_seq1:3388-3582(-)